MGQYGPLSFQEFVNENGGDPAYADPGAAAYVRDQHSRAAQDILDAVERENRKELRADEKRRFDAHMSEYRKFDQATFGSRGRRVHESRAALGLAGSESLGSIQTFGGGTYRKGDPTGPSWVRDMIAVSLNRGDVADARDRLVRNTREVQGETRALTTTDGAGGDFVPPLWLVQEYIALARAKRVTANLVRNQTLPPGTDQLNVPRLATGTATAEQTTQNTAVQNTDATTSAVAAQVATLAGQQVIALQLIEQSPINMDEMLLQDLLNDLASKTDTFVLNNNATNKWGLLQVGGTLASTYTSASPTVAGLYPKFADAMQQIATNRFDSADAIVMHPRRWAWMLAAVDGNQRPLIVPSGQGPYNTFGQYNGPANNQTGLAGEVAGLPVYLDPLIPTNLGAGTNQDVVLVLKRDDHVLFEGVPRAEAFRETKADQLSVLLRVYNYVAMATRYPKGICVISGTGLTPPTF